MKNLKVIAVIIIISLSIIKDSLAFSDFSNSDYENDENYYEEVMVAPGVCSPANNTYGALCCNGVWYIIMWDLFGFWMQETSMSCSAYDRTFPMD